MCGLVAREEEEVIRGEEIWGDEKRHKFLCLDLVLEFASGPLLDRPSLSPDPVRRGPRSGADPVKQKSTIAGLCFYAMSDLAAMS